MPTGLHEYSKKRNFRKTPEPAAGPKRSTKQKKPLSFVVQEHHASRLHWDFRLELDGVLKSWAVPKGPSRDPHVKRLAVQVEDHPLSYKSFEGRIPESNYGAGNVYIWDAGTWTPEIDPHLGLKKGHLNFSLHGDRLKGRWDLIRTFRQSGNKANWLLVKRADRSAKTGDEALIIGEDTPEKRARHNVKKKKISKGAKVDFIQPELAQLVEQAPEGVGWVHETKFDGYRIQAHIRGGEVSLYTRSGLNWTKKFVGIANALSELNANAVLDGEIVVLDQEGRSDFQKLQNVLKNEDKGPLYYYVFDLLFLDGEDLREKSLLERKKILKDLLADIHSENIRYSEHLKVSGKKFFHVACAHKLEGIVSKQTQSAYESGRNGQWVKAKCSQRQEFVIGGYTEGKGARKSFGALLLGIYRDGKLHYAGRAGTGFNGESILNMMPKLRKLEMAKSPFVEKVPGSEIKHWLKPNLVAEISFSNWTHDQILRVPVFHGLREDKAASEVSKEVPLKIPKKKSSKTPLPGITNPEAIVYAREKITKGDIVDYYTKAASLMLPLIAHRPLSLFRCPSVKTDGKTKCFFQKHMTAAVPKAVLPVSIQEKNETRVYMSIDSLEGLLALVQLRAYELHVWNCRAPDIEWPDQIVLDFDPDEKVKWSQVVKAAFHLKGILDELKLISFVKLTGGKGVHVHIPLPNNMDWDEAAKFAKNLAMKMVQDDPHLYTTNMSKRARVEKIFVDYIRNKRGQTSVAPYSLRVRAESSVAMPLTWAELRRIRSADYYDLKKALKRISSSKKNPWRNFG